MQYTTQNSWLTFTLVWHKSIFEPQYSQLNFLFAQLRKQNIFLYFYSVILLYMIFSHVMLPLVYCGFIKSQVRRQKMIRYTVLLVILQVSKNDFSSFVAFGIDIDQISFPMVVRTPRQFIVEYYLHWTTTFDISFSGSSDTNHDSFVLHKLVIKLDKEILHSTEPRCMYLIYFFQQFQLTF